MVLETVEVAAFNLWLEQVDCRSSHEIVHGRIGAIQNDLDLLTSLVELDLLSWVNSVVLEVEGFVLKLRDWHASVEVNWSLQDTIAHRILLIRFKQVKVGSHPIVLDELARSLVQSIQEILRVIVVKVTLNVIVRAARHAAHQRKTTFPSANISLHFTKIVGLYKSETALCTSASISFFLSIKEQCWLSESQSQAVLRNGSVHCTQTFIGISVSGFLFLVQNFLLSTLLFIIHQQNFFKRDAHLLGNSDLSLSSNDISGLLHLVILHDGVSLELSSHDLLISFSFGCLCFILRFLE